MVIFQIFFAVPTAQFAPPGGTLTIRTGSSFTLEAVSHSGITRMEWRLNRRVLESGGNDLLQTRWTVPQFEPTSHAGLYQVFGTNPAGVMRILEEWLVLEEG